MREGNIFTLCVSPHLDRGGGGRDTTPARTGWWGVPQSGLDGGGDTPARSGWGDTLVTPQPGLDGGEGYPPTTRT